MGRKHHVLMGHPKGIQGVREAEGGRGVIDNG